MTLTRLFMYTAWEGSSATLSSVMGFSSFPPVSVREDSEVRRRSAVRDCSEYHLHSMVACPVV